MKRDESDFVDAIPPPLLDWLRSQRALPEAMLKVRTFHETVKVAENIDWPRRVDHLAALNFWATAALIVDERTRKYMARLIQNETEGLQWSMTAGTAICAALDCVEQENATSPGRRFTQRRNAAVKGLRLVRENLAALDADFRLRDLLVGPEVRKFRRAVEKFEREDSSRRTGQARFARERANADGSSAGEAFVASWGELVKWHGCKVPHFIDLIRAAEARVQRMIPPLANRHSARSQYLRELFRALKGSAIERTRIAFLSYASEAVFDQSIEKCDLRRLVSDLAAIEREREALWAGMPEIDLGSLGG